MNIANEPYRSQNSIHLVIKKIVFNKKPVNRNILKISLFSIVNVEVTTTFLIKVSSLKLVTIKVISMNHSLSSYQNQIFSQCFASLVHFILQFVMAIVEIYKFLEFHVIPNMVSGCIH